MDDMDHQYRIIAAGAGWIDRSARGKIRLDGVDALPFLQALVSNDVLALQPSTGAYAAYLTPQGRLIADLDILNRGSSVMLLTPDSLGATLAARFDSLIFAEKLAVTDVSAEWSELAVVGARAAPLAAGVCGCAAADLEALPELGQCDVAGGFIVRTGEASLPVFHLVVPASERAAIASRLSAAGVVEMDESLATALRIDVGRAAWGAELTPETIPLEAGLLERAISTSKGCYVGQEVIIRVLHRGGGRVARKLVVLSFEAAGQAVPVVGEPVSVDGRAVGHLTSSAYSPIGRHAIALAYLHRDAAEVGRTVMCAAHAATITALAR
jgi:folate-binding protein YgfZ